MLRVGIFDDEELIDDVDWRDVVALGSIALSL
jgi:hypothetical protein